MPGPVGHERAHEDRRRQLGEGSGHLGPEPLDDVHAGESTARSCERRPPGTVLRGVVSAGDEEGPGDASTPRPLTLTVIPNTYADNKLQGRQSAPTRKR